MTRRRRRRRRRDSPTRGVGGVLLLDAVEVEIELAKTYIIGTFDDRVMPLVRDLLGRELVCREEEEEEEVEEQEEEEE